MSDQQQAECPINAFAFCTWLKLSWPKTKLPNVRTGDPPSKILKDGVPVEGVEEFIYLGSKQSSNGSSRPDVLRWIGLACLVIKKEGMELQFSQYQHQALIRSVLL